METLVIRPLTLRHLDHAAAPIPAQLRYDPTDPYAVTLRCHNHDEPVAWVFARNLLARAMHAPCGDGDIHLAPNNARTRLTIDLSSPDGHASLSGPTNLIRWFLDATYILVPPGAETIDIDLLLQQLHRSQP